MKGFGDQFKNINKKSSKNKSSQEQIINQAIQLHLKGNITEAVNLTDLKAFWLELVFGLKTEILNNLFLGFELQLKSILKQNNKQGITNLYIPGFNRTYDSSNLGAGFSYSISYLIPVVKK